MKTPSAEEKQHLIKVLAHSIMSAHLRQDPDKGCSNVSCSGCPFGDQDLTCRPPKEFAATSLHHLAIFLPYIEKTHPELLV